MKEALQNPYVISGIMFILGLITIAWMAGTNSYGKTIIKPDTTSVIRSVSSEVSEIV